MKFDCHYCGERKTIVMFTEDGMVPGIMMKRQRACCADCRNAPPAIDGKPSEKQNSTVGREPGSDDNIGEEEYPF